MDRRPWTSATVNGQRSTDWTLADSWIWAKLQTLIRDVERQFQNFQYGQAGQQIYEFIWSDFADWYVEIAKEQMKNEETRQQTVETLVRVFDISCACFIPSHPSSPKKFGDTCELRFSNLRYRISAKDWPVALIVAKFPEPRELEGWEESKIADFTLIQELVRSIRNLRAEKNVAPSKKLAAQFAAGDKDRFAQRTIRNDCRTGWFEHRMRSRFEQSITQKPEDSAALVVGSVEIYIPLAGMVDLANDKPRLEKELKEAQSHIERLEKLLSSDFANKAPAALVAKGTREVGRI